MDDTLSPAVLLLDLPTGALGGIDLLSFTTTPKFKGIKNLPPGIHFVFTGATSALSLRHGAWLSIPPPSHNVPPSITIKKWDAANEVLLAETSSTSLLSHRANLGRLWRENLTPYRQSAAQDSTSTPEANDWIRLSNHISPALLTRIFASSNPDEWTLTSSSSATRDIDHIPGLTSLESTIPSEKPLNFLPVDLKQTWHPSATGRERTVAARDHTYALETLVSTHCGNVWSDVLAELQVSFLMILTLNNYSCLSQWRRILSLILTSYAATGSQPQFFEDALAILGLQLRHSMDVEGGLFDMDERDGASFLKDLLVRFRKSVEDLNSPFTPPTAVDTTSLSKRDKSDEAESKRHRQSVLDELGELEEYLETTHGWSFFAGKHARSGMLDLEDGERVDMDVGDFDEDDEMGEYAPTVVNLSPEQMRILGIDPSEVAAMKTTTSETSATGTSSANGKSGEVSLVERLRRQKIEDGEESDEGEDDEAGVPRPAGSDHGISDQHEDEEEDEEEMDLEAMDARY